MWELLDADIWRDGGSYSATLRSGEKTVSLWLQVASWDRIEDRTYQALFVSEGTDATKQSERAEPAGWLAILESDVDRGTADDNSQKRLEELIANLRSLCRR